MVELATVALPLYTLTDRRAMRTGAALEKGRAGEVCERRRFTFAYGSKMKNSLTPLQLHALRGVRCERLNVRSVVYDHYRRRQESKEALRQRLRHLKNLWLIWKYLESLRMAMVRRFFVPGLRL